MVGTAVYQVGFTSSSQAKNLSALKPGVQWTLAPAASEDSVAAIRPWIWNSGMTLRQRSAGVSWSVTPICRAVAAMLAGDSGTILGRDVVPDVCSTNAMSSGCEKPDDVGLPDIAPRGSSVKPPAGPACGTRSIIGTPSFCATPITGLSMPASITSALALRSER